jgi:hypothetical protein
MWRCVDLASTDISEERIAAIFRVEKSTSGEPAWGGGCYLLTLVHRSWIFLPWRWRRYVPPKRRLTQYLHSATSQKTTFFIVAAVKASNRKKDSRVVRLEEKSLLPTQFTNLRFPLHSRNECTCAISRYSKIHLLSYFTLMFRSNNRD